MATVVVKIATLKRLEQAARGGRFAKGSFVDRGDGYAEFEVDDEIGDFLQEVRTAVGGSDDDAIDYICDVVCGRVH